MVVDLLILAVEVVFQVVVDVVGDSRFYDVAVALNVVRTGKLRAK